MTEGGGGDNTGGTQRDLALAGPLMGRHRPVVPVDRGQTNRQVKHRSVVVPVDIGQTSC